VAAAAEVVLGAGEVVGRETIALGKGGFGEGNVWCAAAPGLGAAAAGSVATPFAVTGDAVAGARGSSRSVTGPGAAAAPCTGEAGDAAEDVSNRPTAIPPTTTAANPAIASVACARRCHVPPALASCASAAATREGEESDATIGGIVRCDADSSRGNSPRGALAGAVAPTDGGGALGVAGIVAANFASSFNSCRIWSRKLMAALRCTTAGPLARHAGVSASFQWAKVAPCAPAARLL